MEQNHPTDAAKAAAPPVSPETTEPTAENAPAQRVPARYNLYARLNVSLRTMDIVITVIVILIIAALIVGICMK